MFLFNREVLARLQLKIIQMLDEISRQIVDHGFNLPWSLIEIFKQQNEFSRIDISHFEVVNDLVVGADRVDEQLPTSVQSEETVAQAEVVRGFVAFLSEHITGFLDSNLRH